MRDFVLAVVEVFVKTIKVVIRVIPTETSLVLTVDLSDGITARSINSLGTLIWIA